MNSTRCFPRLVLVPRAYLLFYSFSCSDPLVLFHVFPSDHFQKLEQLELKMYLAITESMALIHAADVEHANELLASSERFRSALDDVSSDSVRVCVFVAVVNFCVHLRFVRSDWR